MNRFFALALVFALGLCPASAQFVQSPPFGAGQIPGTVTNDSASAGNVGQFISAGNNETGTVGTAASGVTITIASPGVLTWPTTIPFAAFSGTCAVVNFTTNGALPTGLVAGTNYYVIGASISGNTFQVATTCDNAIAATAINTSGSQSGTHSGVPAAIMGSDVTADIAGMSLTAGDWDVSVNNGFVFAASTSVTFLGLSSSTTSATVSNFSGRAMRFALPASIPGTATSAFHSGPARFSLSATTTVYCVSRATFTASTLSSFGGCRARRMR